MPPGPHQLPADPPLPTNLRTLLLYGGTFDPPHIAHAQLPPAARDVVGADWLLYIPAAASPFKPEGPVAPDEHRLAMLRLALEGVPRASVSSIELDRRGVSYTLDTVRAVRDALGGGVTLRLLMGADQAVSFHRWREPREIISLAEPVVMLRPPDLDANGLAEQLAPHWSEDEVQRWRARCVQIPIMHTSSSDIRADLRALGPDAPRVIDNLPPTVLEYIRTHALYR